MATSLHSSQCFSAPRVFLRSIPGQHRIRTLLSYCRRLLCDRSAAALVPGRTNFLSTLPTTCQGVGRAPPRLKFLSYSIPGPEDIAQFLNIARKVKGYFFKKFSSVRPNWETKNMRPPSMTYDNEKRKKWTECIPSNLS